MNADKATSNIREYQVRFAEGATFFANEEALTIKDPDHSGEDYRFMLVRLSRMGRILVSFALSAEHNFASSALGRRRGRSEAIMKKADSRDLYDLRLE